MSDVICVDISSMTVEDYRRLYAQAQPNRQERAAQYPRQADKNRCITADALLRYAVSQRLGLCQFTVGADFNGKPYLPDHPDFHFNLSHSGRYVVIAYGDCPLGVDIQQMDPQRNYAQLAQRHYTPAEQEFLCDRPGDCRIDRFYQVWTAKESYLKYLGIGLRKSLNSFCTVDNSLEVQFETVFLPEHCLTLCSQQGGLRLQHITISQL